jgi:hypothetical protein
MLWPYQSSGAIIVGAGSLHRPLCGGAFWDDYQEDITRIFKGTNKRKRVLSLRSYTEFLALLTSRTPA